MDMRKLKKLLMCVVCVLYLTMLYALYDATGDPEPSPADFGFREELLAAWPHLNFSDLNLRVWLQLTNRYFHQTLRIDSLPYVVETAGCRIPSHNPVDATLWDVVRPGARVDCRQLPALTVVRRVRGHHVLSLDRSPAVLGRYMSWGRRLSCCYEVVSRVHNEPGARDQHLADSTYNISRCKYFQWETTLEAETEFIYVKCFTRVLFWMEVETYSTMHAIVPTKPEVEKRLQEYEQSQGARRNSTAAARRRANVILLGIDSCSRLNLLRTMPRTLSRLRADDGWTELRGYLKVGANTLPNFMALLAGLRADNDGYGACMPRQRAHMDACPFLWAEFARRGYATALAEDEPYLGSFNHEKTGFVRQPADHYLRPFMLAAYDHLPARRRRGILTACLGYVPTTEYVLRYLADFAAAYAGHPFFGLFWLNNFSHENPNDVAGEDERFASVFDDARRSGMLNTSVVVFFSDHGTRFGPLRETSIGWFEDRMPFLHVWLPPWFRDDYPRLAENLRRNADRLTSPFDVHATLKEVLRLQDGFDNDDLAPVGEGPGLSLFREVPGNRTCADAGVGDEWCACVRHEVLEADDPRGAEVAGFAVGRVQEVLDQRSGGLCARLSLQRVKKLAWRQEQEKGVFAEYVVEFETTPGHGLFEATVRRSGQTLSLTGSVKRVNRYGSQSACTHDLALKEFCYCL